MIKFKKFIACICIITTLTFSTFAYSNLAQQQVGLAAVGAGALNVVLALATGTAVAVSGGLALALVGGLILYDAANTTNATQQSAPLTIQLNPNIPLVAPAGWTPAIPPATQPTPPSTATPTKFFRTFDTTSQNGTELCNQPAIKQGFCGSTTACGTATAVETSATAFQCRATRTSDGVQMVGNGIIFYECPTGYGASGTSCTLNNAPIVVKPVKGKMEIVRSGNTFAVDPRINPLDIIPPSVVTVTPSKITVNHSTGAKSETTINPDGTSSISTSTPNSNNTTTTVTSNFSVPAAGTGMVTVTGASQRTVDGTGISAGTTASTASSPAIDISSLNKEVTQGQIKGELTKLNDYMKCDDCTLPVDKTIEEKKKLTDEIKKSVDELDKAADDYAKFKDYGWTTWVPSMPSGSCSPITGQIHGQNVNWNLCPHVEKLNSLLGWLMNLFGAWTITGMFFKRD